MKLLNKVKNFFYEDDEDIEDETEEEIPVKKEKPSHKDKKIRLRDDFSDTKEISERELFKAERTFNFPMDIEDDDSDFHSAKEEVVKEVVKKEPLFKITPEKKDISYSGIRSYAKTEERKEEREVKKFKPTPVISPIYGIMDKNYKKEDIIIDSAEDYRAKKVDYDTVRRKAYGNVYNTEEEKKDIFYNLDEEKEEVEDNDDEVKIIYNDVTLDEDDENITIGERQEKYERELSDDDIDDDSDILSQTKEQDLFNLIDSMYNSDEDDDEEE